MYYNVSLPFPQFVKLYATSFVLIILSVPLMFLLYTGVLLLNWDCKFFTDELWNLYNQVFLVNYNKKYLNHKCFWKSSLINNLIHLTLDSYYYNKTRMRNGIVMTYRKCVIKIINESKNFPCLYWHLVTSCLEFTSEV